MWVLYIGIAFMAIGLGLVITGLVIAVRFLNKNKTKWMIY